MTDVKPALRKILQAFPLESHSLEPDSPLYVYNLHDDSLVGDPVAKLCDTIDGSEGAPIYLFSGLIGAGKTTEMKRLRKLLEERGHCAIYLNMAQYVNLDAPIEITDLLISMLGALSDAVEEATGTDLKERSFFARAAAFLQSEVKFKEFEIGGKAAGPGEIAAKLKLELHRDPVFKVRLQHEMQGFLGAFVEECKAFLGDAAKALRTCGRAKDGQHLVLLLDSLEQLRGRGGAGDPVLQSIRQLYTRYFDELHLRPFQVVYSVPPYLLQLEPQLGDRFASNICNLTCVHVFKDHSRQSDPRGVGLLREVVSRRLLEWRDLISEDQLDRLIHQSGGDLRGLFRLMRNLHFVAPSAAALPLSDVQVDNAIRLARRDAGQITDDVMDRLVWVYRNFEPAKADQGALDRLGEDLETKRVLLYRNGADWYGVNPVLWPDVETAAGTIARGP